MFDVKFDHILFLDITLSFGQLNNVIKTLRNLKKKIRMQPISRIFGEGREYLYLWHFAPFFLTSAIFKK